MNHSQTFQNLSEHCQEKCVTLLEKLDRFEHVNDNDAREALRTLSQECSYVSDPQMSQQACRLLSKAYSLDEPVTNFLLKAADPGYQHSIFDHADNCPMLLNVVRKMDENYDFSQHLQKFVPFLHNKFQNTNTYKTIATIARNCSLSEQDAAELLKAETHPQQCNMSDELIRKLDENRKLPELPNTAFETTMQHIRKKLQLTEQQITYVSQIEKNNSDVQNEVNLLHSSLPNTNNLHSFPQRTCQMMQQQANNTHDEVKKFLTEINAMQLPAEFCNAMPNYVQLLNQIESNPSNQPNDANLEQLSQLYDMLESIGKRGILPNHSQAYLENYQTEKELKGKFFNLPTNVQDLIRALENAQQLTPFQTIHLLRHIKKHSVKLPSRQALRLEEAHKSIDKNLIALAEDMDDLIDSRMLTIFDEIIKKIQGEEKDRRDSYVVIRELSKTVFKVTSAPGEPRLRDKLTVEEKAKRKALLKKFLEDINAKNTYNIDALKDLFRIHWGTDISSHAYDGKLHYVPDSRMGNPDDVEATLLNITYNSGKKEYGIYIAEANPEVGILITIYHHVKKLLSDFTTDTRNIPLSTTEKAELGTYAKINTLKKEHTHIEKLFLKKEDAADLLGIEEGDKPILSDADKAEIHNKINAFISNKAKPIDQMQEPELKTVGLLDYRLKNGGNKELFIIEMFTPGTATYKHYVHELTTSWIDAAEGWHRGENLQLIEKLKGGVGSADDIRNGKQIKDNVDMVLELLAITKISGIRNLLQLEVMNKILLQAKILTQQVNQPHAQLEALIQSAQRAYIDLDEAHKTREKQST